MIYIHIYYYIYLFLLYIYFIMVIFPIDSILHFFIYLLTAVKYTRKRYKIGCILTLLVNIWND